MNIHNSVTVSTDYRPPTTLQVLVYFLKRYLIARAGPAPLALSYREEPVAKILFLKCLSGSAAAPITISN
jgi:hypothetical protein